MRWGSESLLPFAVGEVYFMNLSGFSIGYLNDSSFRNRHFHVTVPFSPGCVSHHS